MESGKNQDEWQELAEARLEDAEVLLKNGRFAAAYYLAGYSVECALKARIASLVKAGDFPPKPEYVRNKLYQHNLETLLVAAELRSEFDELSKQSPSHRDQWKTVKDWSEESRYERQDARTAEDMLESARGVVECIKPYW